MPCHATPLMGSWPWECGRDEAVLASDKLCYTKLAGWQGVLTLRPLRPYYVLCVKKPTSPHLTSSLKLVDDAARTSSSDVGALSYQNKWFFQKKYLVIR